MGEHLGPEQLGRDHLAAQRRLLRRVAGESRILELLGTDPEADRLADMGFEPGTVARQALGHGERLPADTADERAVLAVEQRLDQIHVRAAR